MSSIVRLEGVTKNYGEEPVMVHALRGVDLSISSGEVCGGWRALRGRAKVRCSI